MRALINLGADKMNEHNFKIHDFFLRRINRSTFELRLKRLAAGEGVEPSSSGSKPDVLPVTPSRKSRQSLGALGFEPRTLR
jgi:hypothetical protein